MSAGLPPITDIPRRERPCRSRAAKQHNAGASFHSITSSARPTPPDFSTLRAGQRVRQVVFVPKYVVDELHDVTLLLLEYLPA